jgi:hypothetical protein
MNIERDDDSIARTKWWSSRTSSREKMIGLNDSYMVTGDDLASFRRGLRIGFDGFIKNYALYIEKRCANEVGSRKHVMEKWRSVILT